MNTSCQSALLFKTSVDLLGKCLLVLLLLSSCSQLQGPPESRSKEMVLLLEEAAKNCSNWRNPFMHEFRVTHFDSIMRFHPDIEQQQLGHFQKSLELLYAGRTEEAVTSLLQLQDKMPDYRYFLGAGYQEKEDMLHSALAVSYLRLGEQKNCLLNHNSASCVIPISEEGQHQWKEGSEKAISVYTKILEENPEDYEAMWLMNIAT